MLREAHYAQNNIVKELLDNLPPKEAEIKGHVSDSDKRCQAIAEAVLSTSGLNNVGTGMGLRLCQC